MCLFPGMMQSPAEIATPAAKKYQCLLYILVILHFALSIMYCIFDAASGIMEMIVAMILICTAYSMNFCMLIFYMIMMISDFVNFLCIIGLEV
jgi:hypothetical protein